MIKELSSCKRGNRMSTEQANQTFSTQQNNNRSLIQYRSGHEVRLPGGLMSFSGFRYKGQYQGIPDQKIPSKSLMQNGSVIVDTQKDLAFGMSEQKKENWYAVFACANDEDDTITYKCSPFLRIRSRIKGTSNFYLMVAGEGIHEIGDAVAYGWDNREMWDSHKKIGADILICTETIDGRANAMSGRVTTINNAGVNSIGFDNFGRLGSFDYVLPAPRYDHYRYCGAYYIDTKEVRNFADAGGIVVTRGITQKQLPVSGADCKGRMLSVAGYISPLATAVILNSKYVINNTKEGNCGERFQIDEKHDVASFYVYKSCKRTVFQSLQIILPFSFRQEYYWKTIEDLMCDRTDGQHNLYGWIEP